MKANPHDRYLSIVEWARKRYQDANGTIILDTGGVPSVYSKIEEMAWRKYITPIVRDNDGCLVFPSI